MYIVACYFHLSAKPDQTRLFYDLALARQYAIRRRKHLNRNWLVTVNRVKLDIMEVI